MNPFRQAMVWTLFCTLEQIEDDIPETGTGPFQLVPISWTEMDIDGCVCCA
ncbi:hypothetical protein [uncultured Phocaeicola sp.]|uniref:hypothetical protein n=1 Tax=uncultured Phocaeicola sp. TaxID=990718 RepID=UPI00262440CA|nr:hypothetical protein [uncultured Phocaeicola sp.]